MIRCGGAFRRRTCPDNAPAGDKTEHSRANRYFAPIDAERLIGSTKAGRQTDPVQQAGHLDVREYEIDVAVDMCVSERLVRADSLDNVETHISQFVRKKRSEERFILNDEDIDRPDLVIRLAAQFQDVPAAR